MSNIGIVEGFFGPEWSHEARLSFPAFLKTHGGDFYIYAPKRDAHLRKLWREQWPEKYVRDLSTLRDAFQSEGIEFGVALSPFGLGEKPTPKDLEILKQQLRFLSELKIDRLGLFFDDMPSTDNLLAVQTQVVKMALEFFPQGLLFCPSYYTFDPILDKVFGQRPAGYVEGLTHSIPSEVEICWTGPKVISEEITFEHLKEVTNLLGRKPFIWENLYANDGPRNCKFLKLKNFLGRDHSLLTETSGVAFNLMNQPYLSQVLFLSSVFVMRDKLDADSAFGKSCETLLTKKMSAFMMKNRDLFLKEGLDKISPETKQTLCLELNTILDAQAFEVKAWLSDEYLVGPECLTD